MVLIALAIVFGGLGALSLSRSDSGDSGSSSAATPSVAPLTGSANAPAGSARSTTTYGSGGTSGAGSAAATTTPAQPADASASGAGASGGAGGSAAVDKSVAVRVFNNSSITGLASKTADELKADGWNVAETGNYSEGQIPKTTVYYGDSASERQAAEAVASAIGATAEQRFPGIRNSSPGVIVIVTQ